MEEPEVVEEADQDAETVAWEGDIDQFEVHPTIKQQIEQVEEQDFVVLTCIETHLSTAPAWTIYCS
ncbi:hypothetical protein BDA99DRAFT_566926 [Phascolomyces articulosus]|uniref:Uncharacterized protein n=1 Tax=Phascolomyces articulosus TaxID=60185 RepID=A0AAD5JJU4_9FUNG|nr:hypothetical protein BDA99DRAFT_566926 [Phascolomyces articulosus]